MGGLDAIMPWISAALAIIALGTQVKTILGAGEKKLDERLTKAETKLIDHDRRIQSVEDELKHLPDKDTVTDIRLAMAELKGTVATLGESVGSISRTVHRIDDYLRNEGKG